MTLPESSGTPKAGDLFLDEGLITPEDVDRVLSLQETDTAGLARDRLFGMVLCDLNLVTPVDNYCTLDKHGKLMSLDAFLVKNEILSRSRLAQLRQGARDEGLPLISFLLDQKVIQKSLLAQILFELFHIPLRSVSEIVFNQGGRDELARIIPKAEAVRHQCIPLTLTGNTLMIGITDPSNLIFLKGLDQEWPRYRLSPVFISFSGFTWFFRMLYKEDWAGQKPSPEQVDLSLLMNFSILVRDLEADRDKIISLFRRYERVREARQAKEPEEGNRKALFLEFIGRHYLGIRATTGCGEIRFSLTYEKDRLLIQAAPEEKG